MYPRWWVLALDASILFEDEILDGFVQIEGELCPSHLFDLPYPRNMPPKLHEKNGTHAIYVRYDREDEPMIDELSELFRTDHRVRFFQRFPHLAHEQLVRYCQIDYDRELCHWYGLSRMKDTKRSIGDVRMIKLADMERADMAIMVF